MDLQCRCSACSATFRVSAAAAGKKARCPKCSAVVDVPAEGVKSPTAPVKPATSTAPPATSQAPKAAPAPPRPKPPVVESPPTAAVPAPAPSPPESSAGDFPPLVTSSPAATGKSKLDFSFANESPPDSSVLSEDAPEAVENETQSAPTSSAGEFAFTRTKPAAKSTTNTSSLESPRPGKPVGKPAGKKSKSMVPLFIGGGILTLVVLIGGGIGIALMLGGSTKKSLPGIHQGDRTAAAKATLILDWPETERSGSAVSIDGKRLALPAKGEAKYALNPGSKKLVLQRRGFANVETTLPLESGKTARFAPKWETILAGGPVKPSSVPAEGSAPSTNFPIGGAAPSSDLSPQGFAGWFQLVETAQRQASERKKELLIVFGSSDTDSDTQLLAREMGQAPAKDALNAGFVPVIIDFPQTARGHRVLEDAHQNQTLARQYGIRSVPVIVLADEKGLPYFMEREWKAGGDLAKNLESWKQKRAERDQLLTATRAGDDDARVAAAEKVLEWLKKEQLLLLYADEVRAWFAIAQRVDATNSAGKLEAFAEADLLLRLRDVDPGEEENITAAIAPLQEWMGKKRFVNPDRGASLHLLAAAILLKFDRDEEGLKHLGEASTYEPKDKDLKERLATAKDMLKNRNIRSFGTGFVISEDGYLLTNHHVVEGDGQVMVRLKGVDQPVPATVIAEDANRDMALIKIDPPSGVKLAPIPLAGGTLGRGAAVIAFGYPLVTFTGEGVKLTEGVVSALPDKDRENMYLLDMRINPGNSGGPLCDSKGNVAGMITAKTGRGFEGIDDTYGMAIPAPDLVKFLEQHLPKAAAAVPAAGTSKLSTEEVDQRVSPAVMLILKTK